ncbi:MAG TPA: DNA-binding domain-containing protein [Frateuria sp.]|uniref:DNA-binding domain-containing protein n=1 Tax=Frateuria sp. TaxID=2211372 RepID=UPI002D810F7B|nr:DNA-binding domain-containing protein [Frateuria sp.]HET6806185.1 DNA-binding domain-containing protein [Frateuria sp.]
MPMPPSLHELQRAFGAALVGGDGEPLAPWIAARGIEPAARLRIYRHANLAIHVEALATSFPATLRLLGEACFDGVATRHAAWIGSTSGNLQAYGADFPGFLAAQPELAAYAWVAEVARLEWLRQETALAAPGSLADPLALVLALAAAIDPVVRLQPHLRVCSSTVPVLGLWRYAMESGRTVAPDGSPEHVLLWRAPEGIAMRAVGPALADFAGALLAGERLAAACARAPATAPQELLARLLEHGLIAAISPATEDASA